MMCDLSLPMCCAQSKNFRAISREDLSAMFREETGHDMTQLVGGGEWTLSCLRGTVAKQTCSKVVGRRSRGLSVNFVLMASIILSCSCCILRCVAPAGIQDTLREVTEIIAAQQQQQTAAAAAAGGAQRGVLVVCGTGYIMPEARAFLGIIEPR
jgi:hypothetical protein